MQKKGNKWGDNSTEQDPRLQAAVLTLTKRPVCPSNKIGVSNHPYLQRSWIRCCKIFLQSKQIPLSTLTKKSFGGKLML